MASNELRGGGSFRGRGRGFSRANSHIPKPIPQEETPEMKIRSEIVVLADTTLSMTDEELTNKLKEQITSSASFLKRFDPQTYNKIIAKTIVDCVSVFPVKSPIYACLISTIDNFELSKLLIETILTQLHSTIGSIQTTSTKLLLRFLSDLSRANVLKLQSLKDLIETISISASKSNNSQIGDWLLHILVLTLAWNGAYLSSKDYPFLSSLNQAFINYFEQRKAKNDWLSNEWDTIYRIFQGNRWENPSPPSVLLNDLFKDFFTKEPKHEIGKLEIDLDSMKVKLFPISYIPPKSLELYTYNSPTDQNQPIPLELFLMGDCFMDILEGFSDNSSNAAKFVMKIPHPADQAINKLSYSYLIELILSRILAIPPLISGQKPIFYSAVLVHLTKNAGRSIGPPLVDGIRVLINRLEQMDTEQMDRFTEWFAYQLSNLDYFWSWENL